MPAVALPLAVAAVPIAGPLAAALIAAVPTAAQYAGMNPEAPEMGRVGGALRWLPGFVLLVAAAACARIPDDATLALLDRSLGIGPIARANAVLGCGTAALVALFGAASSQGAGIAIAAAVVASSLVVAAFAGEVARVGAAGIHVAMMVSAITITLENRGGSTARSASSPGWRAASSYLTLGSLGLVTIVAGLSLADVLRVSPGGLVTEAFVIAVLAAGFALAIGLPPLHYWVPVVAWRPSAGSATLALGVVMPAAVGYLVQVLASSPQLGGAMLTARLLTVGGLVACAVGAVGAVSPGRLGRRVGYAAISGIGPVLLGLGTGTRIGVAGAMVALAHHALCTIILVATSGAVAYADNYQSGFAASGGASGGSLASSDTGGERGASRRTQAHVGSARGQANSGRLLRVAFILAAVAASGIPPLGGFASRWAIMQALSLADWRLGMAVGVTSLVTLAALLSGVARTPLSSAESGLTRNASVGSSSSPNAEDADLGIRGVGGGGRLLVVYAVAACTWGVAPAWLIEQAWRATVQMGYLRPF